MSEKLWTSLELAKEAGITRRRVLQLLAEGKELHGQQLVNGQWVIPDSEAQRWLAKRHSSPEEA